MPPLSHCDDPLIHELFIAIIRLFNLFCEYSETVSNPTSKRLFEDVSLSLNDSGRETGLFNCLEVPNDEVKLAVVDCLNNVPLSEFDNEEISQIIKQLSQCKNIGAGKTEVVISKIMWILTKLAKDREEEAGKSFRLKFGERAVNEVIEIMLRNQARRVEDTEEGQEKMALSLSCLQFLKYSSANNEMRKYLMNRHDQIMKLLFLDE